MGNESFNEEMGLSGVINELRKLRGLLNVKGSEDESLVLVEITTLKVQVQHLQSSIKELRTALWGIAASILALVIKMVVEGSLFR